MDSDDVAAVVAEVTALVNEHYVDPAAAVQITRALAASLAGGRYAADEQSLAAAVTADLQSVNGDKHLRLVYHAAPLPASEHGDDAAEYAAMASWADRTGHGIARVEWLTPNGAQPRHRRARGNRGRSRLAGRRRLQRAGRAAREFADARGIDVAGAAVRTADDLDSHAGRVVMLSWQRDELGDHLVG